MSYCFNNKFSDYERKAYLHPVRIYFKISTFDKINRDERFNFETKLGTIGGIIGLYNGACFLSLVEWLYFLFPILILFSRRKYQQIVEILRNSITAPKAKKKEGNTDNQRKKEDTEPRAIQINLPDVDV